MKVIKYYILAPIHGLIDSMLKQPVLIFILLYTMFNLSYITLALLFAAVLFSSFFHMIIGYRNDRNTFISFNNFLDEYNNYTFIKIEPKDIFKKFGNIDMAKQTLRAENFNIDVYVAQKNDFQGKRYTTFTSFPMQYNESVIVLPDFPDNLNEFQIFKFFHELGHLSSIHIKMSNLNTYAFPMTFYLWFMVALFVKSPVCIASTFFISAIWLYNYNSLSVYLLKSKNHNMEMVADFFAISHLYPHDKNESNKIVLYEKIKKTYKEKIEEWDNMESWISGPVNIEDNKVIKATFKNSFIKRHLNNIKVNYDSFFDSWITPKPVINLTYLIMLICASYFSTSHENNTIITGIITLLPIPLVYLVRVVLGCFMYKNKVKSNLMNRDEQHTANNVYTK